MKNVLSFIALATICSTTVLAQENSLMLSGGWTFGNIESLDESTSGWRINLLYEFTPNEGHFSHGVSFGYIRNKTTVSQAGSELKSGHWPLYYAPKYTFLQPDAFRPFVKGALGVHFSSYDREGVQGGDLEAGDFGFYGGLGAGISKSFKNNLIINVEYEWAYLSNSWYRDGFINSVMFGIGIKF